MLFVCQRVVRAAVQHLAFGGEAVFLPLLLNADQRPLPRTEAEVLETRYGEEILLAVFRHPMIVQVTPCGMAALSISIA